MRTRATHRLTCLALTFGLVLTACGGGDGDGEAEGSLVIRTDAEGNVVDEDGTPLDDAGTVDTADGTDTDAQEPVAASTGAGPGEVVVDGRSHVLGEVVRCPAEDAPPPVPENLDGLADLMESISTLGIVGTGDEGRFQLYLSELDIGARALSLLWEQGPGDATFSGDFGQMSEDRPWTEGDGMTEPDQQPVALADGRVSGAAVLASRDGETVTVSFDLPIPADATC